MDESSKTNVLLVDDRPENLLVMQSILENEGHNLVSVSSGRDALKFLLAEEVALILLDVQMPGLNGFELAELIREREQTQHTPIIFISATSVDEAYVFKGYSLGAVDYLTKPVSPEIVKSKVNFFVRLFRQNQEIKRQKALLEEANAQLDQMNAELELRVQRRTAELHSSNVKLEKQIASRKQSEARLAIEHSITRTLARAESLEAAAAPILSAFCEHLDAAFGAIWVLDDSASSLTCFAAYSPHETDEFRSIVRESLIAAYTMGIGVPGQVWNENAPVWLDGEYRGPKYPRAQMATAAGIRTAVGFPVMIGDEFYGVIEIFAKEPLKDKQALMNMFFAIGSEIGQFVRRRRIEAERENLLMREKTLRQQAEKANRMKDEFLATVSHELRTPLNSILGWGQILNSGGLTEAEQKNALEAIFRNAKSQSQLIDDLLDTSRLIGGNVHLELSPTPITPLIEAAIEVARPAAAAKDIEITYELRTDVESITCDAQRLQQMVWNLLTNAVKFTPKGGSVRIFFDRVDNQVEITVEDTGNGIAPEFRPHVFDRFRQADSSSTRSHDGLGLGLAIVRHLAELHGGTVSVESEGIGKGATFTISLPLTLTTYSSDEPPSHPQTNGSAKPDGAPPKKLDGVRVLIVDDDSDASGMLRFALSSSGAEVRTSGSVPEAFVELNEWIPDVLLADINMPGEDGYSLIRQLRAREPEDGADIPAIALTAMARPEDSERALSSGFQLHIAKPVDIEDLSRAVRRLVERRIGRPADTISNA
jgi:signal transduction histidine kinase/DNA-binding response OmpR family regulator